MFTESTPYFSVMHDFSAYLLPWPNDKRLPTEDELRAMLPASLLLISEVKSLEADCLLQLRHLDDDAKSVVDYLKLQSRKIDIVLQHVLDREEHKGEPVAGTHFGGSGITIISDESLVVDEQFQVTIHIKQELVSLLCFVRVCSCEPLVSEESGEKEPYLVQLEFSQILESDIEQLVKASLSVQQKQLKLRKKARKGL